mmetsp:Transcript_97728/g.276453  ORF Transcript_97728/g.276453 Transcript_97728/m.276453 type:complete len:351 (+) Transcript_97728:92-1144(+)|eukprot:CAMPEP_0117524638 /NCGR_PEP_ID=MMETSP0784-20121206/35353_1 /TAXON_ID=39447 /ORGANISM="" /LENGTH=350 /DNA_ID=CAMNT_0005320801 /DNA_START=27 /DNA_END=1079 /DNA_ORIENTATION=-
MVSPARMRLALLACFAVRSLLAAAAEVCSSQQEATHGPAKLLQVALHLANVEGTSETAVHPLGDTSLQKGIAHIRVPKTGSSTMKLVVSRLSILYGLNLLNLTYYSFDGSLTAEGLAAEIPSPSYYSKHDRRSHSGAMLHAAMPEAKWVSMVRDPQGMCMSMYYHKKGVAGEAPTDASKIEFIDSDPECTGDFISTYLEETANSTANQILEIYNFVGVTERYDESLLALKHVLQLNMSDVFYVKFRDSSKPCNWPSGTRHWIPLEHPSVEEESAAVRQALDEKIWTRDRLLVAAANKKLDSVIAAYGPSYQDDLELFQSRLASLSSECGCLDHYGPSIDCINEMATQHGW